MGIPQPKLYSQSKNGTILEDIIDNHPVGTQSPGPVKPSQP